MNIHVLKPSQTLLRQLIAGALLLACSAFNPLVAIAHTDGDWTLDALMQALAQVKSGHASFVESKRIALLDAPVESSGELFYSAPDRLEKRTLKPKPEAMLLQGNTLTVERSDSKGRSKKHVLQLQSYPEIAAFIDSIRGTMAGDRQALERNFKLSLQGSEQTWTLTLEPVNDKMKQVVKTLDMGGVGSELRTIAIRQTDGDSSLMTITPLTGKSTSTPPTTAMPTSAAP